MYTQISQAGNKTIPNVKMNLNKLAIQQFIVASCSETVVFIQSGSTAVQMLILQSQSHMYICSYKTHQLASLPELLYCILVHTIKTFLNTSKVVTGGSVHWTYSSSCSSAILP